MNYKSLTIGKPRNDIELQKRVAAMYRKAKNTMEDLQESRDKKYRVARQAWLSQVVTGYNRHELYQQKQRDYLLVAVKFDFCQELLKVLNSKRTYEGFFVAPQEVFEMLQVCLKKARQDEEYELATVIHEFLAL